MRVALPMPHNRAVTLRTIQWNIGGGKLLNMGADPTLLRSYRREGLDTVIGVIRKLNPDIITLQETHAAHGHSQPELIANALGYPWWANDEAAESHVEKGQKLGQGIISRYPMTSHRFTKFTNPNLEAVWEDGTIATSHDKGCTKCTVDVDGIPFLVQTLHSLPLRRFNVAIDSQAARKIFAEIDAKLYAETIGIIQGDFNIDAISLRNMFPRLFGYGYQEVLQRAVTTPRGHRSDHILFYGLTLGESRTIYDVPTDHYPIVTDFKVVS